MLPLASRLHHRCFCRAAPKQVLHSDLVEAYAVVTSGPVKPSSHRGLSILNILFSMALLIPPPISCPFLVRIQDMVEQTE